MPQSAHSNNPVKMLVAPFFVGLRLFARIICTLSHSSLSMRGVQPIPLMPYMRMGLILYPPKAYQQWRRFLSPAYRVKISCERLPPLPRPQAEKSVFVNLHNFCGSYAVIFIHAFILLIIGFYPLLFPEYIALGI